MNILKKIWENRTIILFGLVILLTFLFLKQCNHSKYQDALKKQNDSAMFGKMHALETKNGEILQEKATLYTTLDQLKTNNKEMYDYFKELKRQGFEVATVNTIKYVFIDSGKVSNKLNHIGDDKYSLDFNYVDNEKIISIDGISKFNARSYIKSIDSNGKYNIGLDITPDSTTFDKIQFRSGIRVAVVKDRDGIDRIVASPNPYTDKIKIDSIETVGLEDYYKKKFSEQKGKKFNIGPSVGYGFCINPSTGKPTIGIFVGVTATYSIIKF